MALSWSSGPGLTQHRWRGLGAKTRVTGHAWRMGAPRAGPAGALGAEVFSGTRPRPWPMGGRGRAAPRPFAYHPPALARARPRAERLARAEVHCCAGGAWIGARPPHCCWFAFRQGMPPHASYLFKHALVQHAAYGVLLPGAADPVASFARPDGLTSAVAVRIVPAAQSRRRSLTVKGAFSPGLSNTHRTSESTTRRHHTRSRTSTTVAFHGFQAAHRKQETGTFSAWILESTNRVVTIVLLRHTSEPAPGPHPRVCSPGSSSPSLRGKNAHDRLVRFRHLPRSFHILEVREEREIVSRRNLRRSGLCKCQLCSWSPDSR